MNGEREARTRQRGPDGAEDTVALPVDALYVVGLFVVAFALRLWVARLLGGEPVWDGHYYDFGARHIASGFGYADEGVRDGRPFWHPWCHYPVGYSAYLAAYYKFFGASHGVAQVANAIVGALLAVVTFLLGREALPESRARIAGALVAIDPGLVIYGALLMTEPLSALLVLGAFFVASRVSRWRPMLGIAAGGLVLGLAVLVRPQALLCAPFLALVLWRARPRPRTLLGGAIGATMPSHPRALRVGAGVVLACVTTLLPVLPWTARNCRVMDGCALVSTNAGWNLAIGAFPRATGRFETLRPSDGCREVTGQVQQDRCWLEYGLANIARTPLRWLALVPAKLAFTFDHESFAVEYLREARPAAWPEDKRVVWRGILTTIHRVLVVASALAFVGVVVRGRGLRRFARPALLFAVLAASIYATFSASAPTFWPIVIASCVLPWLPLPDKPDAPPALLMAVSLIATTVVAHAVFFGEDRYHMVVTPVLCLLAASALRRPRAEEEARAQAEAIVKALASARAP